MGLGDEIMASGMARGAHARGERIAFGNGDRIIFSPWSPIIFKGNPNIAWPGQEREPGIRWIDHYKGHRLYAHREHYGWRWRPEFRPQRGEIFLDDQECAWAAENAPPGLIFIEPTVKRTAGNKQWEPARYQQVALHLMRAGHRVAQLVHAPGFVIDGAIHIRPPSFRHAMAALARARLLIGPEGGLHHAAAAFNIPAVVIFGGFIHPSTTGYDDHINLFSGDIACGRTIPCAHCRAAMSRISADDVLAAAGKLIARKRETVAA